MFPDPWWLGEPRRLRRPRWLRNLAATPWRWRWEWVPPAAVWSLAGHTWLWVAAAVAAAVTLALVVRDPGLRRWFAARVAAVVAQHRLRVGMVRCGLVAPTGTLPPILRTRVVDRGVRMLIWLPAGLTVGDVAARTDLLAVACWSSAVEVRRYPHRAQLVEVLVVRPRRTPWVTDRDPV